MGDTITTVNGKPVKNGDELVAEIASLKPGTKANLGLVRNGKKQDVSIVIADRQKLFASRLGEESEEGGGDTEPTSSKVGIAVRNLTADMAQRLNLPADKGVVVSDVKPNSFADDIGLSRGDVILEINKQPVNNEESFNRIISGLKSKQDVVFLVRPRGVGSQGGTIFMGGTLP